MRTIVTTVLAVIAVITASVMPANAAAPIRHRQRASVTDVYTVRAQHCDGATTDIYHYTNQTSADTEFTFLDGLARSGNPTSIKSIREFDNADVLKAEVFGC